MKSITFYPEYLPILLENMLPPIACRHASSWFTGECPLAASFAADAQALLFLCGALLSWVL